MAHKRLNLIAARTDAGFSQEALAEKLDSNRVTVSNWENGLTEPYPHFKGKLKTLFGIDLSTLLHIFEVADEEEGPLSMQTRPHPIVWQQPPPSAQHFIVNHPTRHFWLIAHTDYDTPSEMTADIQAAIKDLNMTTGDDITRRDALCELASIPMLALGKHGTLHARRYEEMLRYCTAALEGCWELYRGSDPVGTQHAFECASTYMPILETIAHDSSHHRKEALELATQYALLQTLLGWNCIGARETVGHAQNALDLSKESGNILLQLSASTKLSFTYLMGQNCAMALKTMQEGEHNLKEYQRRGKGPALPMGAIANFHSSYSIAQIDNGIDADHALGIATDSEPLSGPVALMEFTTFDQQWEAARAYNSKGDYKKAMKWLKKIIDTETLTLHIPQNEGGRVTTLTTLTSTLLQSQERDMRQIIKVWTASIEGAKALKAEERYRKAMANFTVMRTLWPREDAIKKLMPLTSHW